jgi:hypothetical protein
MLFRNWKWEFSEAFPLFCVMVLMGVIAVSGFALIGWIEYLKYQNPAAVKVIGDRIEVRRDGGR